MRKIQIPWSVEFLGQYCFYKCARLREINFECNSSLKEIGRRAFLHTAANQIEIPEKCEILSGNSLIDGREVNICEKNPFFIYVEGFLKSSDKKILIRYFGEVEEIFVSRNVEKISEGCFRRCTSVQKITFENGSSLKEIGCYAFFMTSIKEIEIPAKCEILSGSSLIGIKEVNICSGNRFFVKDEGCIESSDKKTLLRYIREDEIIIVNQHVEIISAHCFTFVRSIQEIIFEEGSRLTRIEEYAFSRRNLKKIEIPSSVEFIGENCFSHCKSLCEVIFRSISKLKRIEDWAFSVTPLRTITIPSSVEYIGMRCFAKCNALVEVTIERNIREIEVPAFPSQMKSLKLHDGIEVNCALPEKCRIKYIDV
jgi:hypothetical protein